MKNRYVLWAALAAVALFSLGPAAYAEFFQAPYGPGGTWNVYEVITSGAKFSDANAAASTASWNGTNGHLVQLGSVEENNTVHRKAGYQDVWIGLTDREGAAPPAVDGDGDPTPQESQTLSNNRTKGWAWTSGQAVTFTNWGDGEPNDAGGEDAAHLRDDSLWNDNKSGYGAELPMPAMIQAGTSTDESGGPSYKYVIEYPVNSATQIADVPLPTVLPSTPMPGIPGGAGTWGLVEVRGVDPRGNVTNAVNNLLTDPPPAAAQIFTAQVPKLDLTDPETNGSGGPILGDAPIPFLSDTKDGEPGFPGNSDPNNGDDNWIHAVAKGRIKVVEPGDYTIQVRSDDGFALKVHGGSFTAVDGAGQIDPFDSQTIFFPKGTGDANTRGLVNLAAGEYDVEFVWWEGGGGAYYEVTSHSGNMLTNPIGSHWLALGDPSVIPGDTYTQVAQLTSDARVINGASIGDIAAADAIARTRDSVNAALADWANSPKGVANTLVIPEGDMPNGGGDDYTTGIFGEFAVLDTDGQPGEVITFALRTDDGSQLRIIGQDFTGVSSGGGNATLVDVSGDMSLTAEFPTGDTNAFGLITLNEGVYAFEALHYEGGGGSQVEIYAVAGDWLAGGFPRGIMPLTTDTLSPYVIPTNNGLALVPEPSSLVLAGLGMLSLIGLVRRRNG